jgi:hypothetical protein
VSHRARLEICWTGGRLEWERAEDVEAVWARVEEYVRAEGSYPLEAMRESLRQALRQRLTAFDSLNRDWVIGLLQKLSEQFPHAVFGARIAKCVQPAEDLWDCRAIVALNGDVDTWQFEDFP